MRYRKKPVVIEAFVTEEPMDIETLEGTMHASAGDYIITGVNGERYPCKPDIFEKTYEPADTAPLPIDRDALLTLVHEMEDGFRIEGSTGPAHLVVHFVNIEMRKYAARIRRALNMGGD